MMRAIWLLNHLPDLPQPRRTHFTMVSVSPGDCFFVRGLAASVAFTTAEIVGSSLKDGAPSFALAADNTILADLGLVTPPRCSATYVMKCLHMILDLRQSSSDRLRPDFWQTACANLKNFVSHAPFLPHVPSLFACGRKLVTRDLLSPVVNSHGNSSRLQRSRSSLSRAARVDLRNPRQQIKTVESKEQNVTRVDDHTNDKYRTLFPCFPLGKDSAEGRSQKTREGVAKSKYKTA